MQSSWRTPEKRELVQTFTMHEISKVDQNCLIRAPLHFKIIIDRPLLSKQRTVVAKFIFVGQGGKGHSSCIQRLPKEHQHTNFVLHLLAFLGSCQLHN